MTIALRPGHADPRTPLSGRRDLARLTVRVRLIGGERWGVGKTIVVQVVPADQCPAACLEMMAHPECQARRAYVLIDAPDGPRATPHGAVGGLDG